MPVVDGYVVENAIVSLPYAGHHIADTLRANLSEQNSAMYNYQSPVQRFILRYVMEHACYVASDYEAEVAKASKNASDVETRVSLAAFHPTPDMQRYAF